MQSHYTSWFYNIAHLLGVEKVGEALNEGENYMINMLEESEGCGNNHATPCNDKDNLYAKTGGGGGIIPAAFCALSIRFNSTKWRRRESNPRPETFTAGRLRA